MVRLRGCHASPLLLLAVLLPLYLVQTAQSLSAECGSSYVAAIQNMVQCFEANGISSPLPLDSCDQLESCSRTNGIVAALQLEALAKMCRTEEATPTRPVVSRTATATPTVVPGHTPTRTRLVTLTSPAQPLPTDAPHNHTEDFSPFVTCMARQGTPVTLPKDRLTPTFCGCVTSNVTTACSHDATVLLANWTASLTDPVKKTATLTVSSDSATPSNRTTGTANTSSPAVGTASYPLPASTCSCNAPLCTEDYEDTLVYRIIVILPKDSSARTVFRNVVSKAAGVRPTQVNIIRIILGEPDVVWFKLVSLPLGTSERALRMIEESLKDSESTLRKDLSASGDLTVVQEPYGPTKDEVVTDKVVPWYYILVIILLILVAIGGFAFAAWTMLSEPSEDEDEEGQGEDDDGVIGQVAAEGPPIEQEMDQKVLPDPAMKALPEE
eukprot:Sspe_Gene.11866::Locus_4028_Transcript_1_1_Confidence_1.000_Length_1708::g.11866::m.11866